MNSLMIDNLPNIIKLSKILRRKLPYMMESSDLITVGMVTVWELNPNTDPNYIQGKIRWAMLDAMRKWGLTRRSIKIGFVQLEEHDDDELNHDSVDLSSNPEEELWCAQTLIRFTSSLDSREAYVLEAMLDGRSQNDIAKELNLTQPRICQIRSATLKNLEVLWNS